MRDDQKQRVEAALERGFRFMAGDPATYTDPEGEEHELIGMREDVDTSDNEGLLIGPSGMRLIELEKLTFLTADLEAAGVTLQVSGHFTLDGYRYDFAKDKPILAHQVPIAGIQNVVTVRLRRATERKAAQSGEIGFDVGP